VVLHDDASEYFALRAAAEVDGRAPPRRAAAGHPPLRGSMGGFYTTGEVRSEFARLASEYPAWVGAPAKVGSSRNGRDLWVSCVGTNQGRCLADRSRPTVLYTALVHAREPATVMCLVQFLRSLLSSAAPRRLTSSRTGSSSSCRSRTRTGMRGTSCTGRTAEG